MTTTREQLVIGLTGPFGSGCTTAAGMLSDLFGFKAVKLSSFIKDEWARRKKEGTPPRTDLQKLGNELREKDGPGVLAKRTIQLLDAEGRKGGVVVDGIRNVGEIESLRNQYGQAFFLVAIECPGSQRWERVRTTYEKVGLSIEDFNVDNRRDRDEEVATGQQVQLCVDEADVLAINDNDVTLTELKASLRDCVDLVSGEKPRYALPREILMNLAYAASHGSKCLKRQVGAIVVSAKPDEMGEVVGQGFNENPVGTKPCLEEPSYDGRCYRDIVRSESLRKFVTLGYRCAACGEVIAGPILEKPPWRCSKCKQDFEEHFWPERAMSWCTAVHAEVAAVLVAGQRARGATLYTTTFPCFQCAEKITQAGIKEIVFTESYPDIRAAERLELAGIGIHRFEGVRSRRFHEIFSRARPYRAESR